MSILQVKTLSSNRSQMIKRTRFTYFLLEKALKKQANKINRLMLKACVRYFLSIFYFFIE